MSLSVVVNSCSLGPRAAQVTGSHSRTPHAVRAYALKHFILPHYVRYADEVIVAGEYEAGDGYTYLHVPSTYFSAVDALDQRQVGFEKSTGDWVAFVHDDHWLDLSFGLPHGEGAGRLVWVPLRWRRGEGRLINGMEQDPPYVGGHCALYRREVLEKAPWRDVPRVWTWDVEHTAMLHDVGAAIMQLKTMDVWDVEADPALGMSGEPGWA